MKYLWLGLFLACSTAIAAPTGRWYQVEVLIFEQSAAEATDEVFPLAPGRPSRKNTTELRPFHVDNQNDSFVIVPEKERSLQGMRKKLPRVLLHTRWRQWLTAQSATIPVHLYGGTHYSASTLPDFTDLSPPALAPDQSETSLGPYPWEIEGTLTIWLARYLHLEADFVYQKNEKQRRTPYRLVESRRMRSNELHYLDHPQFGMVVLLSPEKETREEVTEASVEAPEPS